MPDEDPETQRALMEQVMEILLEVENLTESERAQVQDGLACIRSDLDATETLAQPREIQYARYLFTIIAKSHFYRLSAVLDQTHIRIVC